MFFGIPSSISVLRSRDPSITKLVYKLNKSITRSHAKFLKFADENWMEEDEQGGFDSTEALFKESISDFDFIRFILCDREKQWAENQAKSSSVQERDYLSLDQRDVQNKTIRAILLILETLPVGVVGGFADQSYLNILLPLLDEIIIQEKDETNATRYSGLGKNVRTHWHEGFSIKAFTNLRKAFVARIKLGVSSVTEITVNNLALLARQSSIKSIQNSIAAQELLLANEGVEKGGSQLISIDEAHRWLMSSIKYKLTELESYDEVTELNFHMDLELLNKYKVSFITDLPTFDPNGKVSLKLEKHMPSTPFVYQFLDPQTRQDIFTGVATDLPYQIRAHGLVGKNKIQDNPITKLRSVDLVLYAPLRGEDIGRYDNSSVDGLELKFLASSLKEIHEERDSTIREAREMLYSKERGIGFWYYDYSGFYQIKGQVVQLGEVCVVGYDIALCIGAFAGVEIAVQILSPWKRQALKRGEYSRSGGYPFSKRLNKKIKEDCAPYWQDIDFKYIKEPDMEDAMSLIYLERDIAMIEKKILELGLSDSYDHMPIVVKEISHRFEKGFELIAGLATYKAAVKVGLKRGKFLVISKAVIEAKRDVDAKREAWEARVQADDESENKFLA